MVVFLKIREILLLMKMMLMMMMLKQIDFHRVGVNEVMLFETISVSVI
jgi:hypothetical protein